MKLPFSIGSFFQAKPQAVPPVPPPVPAADAKKKAPAKSKAAKTNTTSSVPKKRPGLPKGSKSKKDKTLPAEPLKTGSHLPASKAIVLLPEPVLAMPPGVNVTTPAENLPGNMPPPPKATEENDENPVVNDNPEQPEATPTDPTSSAPEAPTGTGKTFVYGIPAEETPPPVGSNAPEDEPPAVVNPPAGEKSPEEAKAPETKDSKAPKKSKEPKSEKMPKVPVGKKPRANQPISAKISLPEHPTKDAKAPSKAWNLLPKTGHLMSLLQKKEAANIPTPPNQGPEKPKTSAAAGTATTDESNGRSHRETWRHPDSVPRSGEQTRRHKNQPGLVMALILVNIVLLLGYVFLFVDARNPKGIVATQIGLTTMPQALPAPVPPTLTAERPLSIEPIPTGFLQKMGDLAFREMDNPDGTLEAQEAQGLLQEYGTNPQARRIIAEFLLKNAGDRANEGLVILREMAAQGDTHAQSLVQASTGSYLDAMETLKTLNPSTAKAAEAILKETVLIDAYKPAVEALAKVYLMQDKTKEAEELLALNAALSDSPLERAYGKASLLIIRSNIPPEEQDTTPQEALERGIDFTNALGFAIQNQKAGNTVKAKGFYDIARNLTADSILYPLLDTAGQSSFVFEMQEADLLKAITHNEGTLPGSELPEPPPENLPEPATLAVVAALKQPLPKPEDLNPTKSPTDLAVAALVSLRAGHQKRGEFCLNLLKETHGEKIYGQIIELPEFQEILTSPVTPVEPPKSSKLPEPKPKKKP
jgi:hypothetical protein